MDDVKSLIVRPIDCPTARKAVERWHYSGTTTRNSQLHLGVFMLDKLLGCMQFGPSLDKRKTIGLVEGTPWNGFLELNRMAFSDLLPRNSESRALSVAMRMLRKSAPHVQWVVSFADGTQCGDGTIYRASGFLLTKISRNRTLFTGPSGNVVSDITLKSGKAKWANGGSSGMKRFTASGFEALPGFQLRYLYPLDPTVRSRLTVPVMPYSSIKEHGAGMYRGKPKLYACEASQGAPGIPAGRGRGSTDPHAPICEP